MKGPVVTNDTLILENGLQVGEYFLEKSLGQGAFGQVYFGRNTETGEVFAIKRLPRVVYDNNPILKNLMITEISIMNKINHPNILHLHKWLETKNNYYLILDYCEKGDLEKLLQRQPGNKFDEATAVGFLKQIMNGFMELHRYKILHRDFKLANIFLTENRVVIGDFGLAKQGKNITSTKLGTPLLMAPEIMTISADNPFYGVKVDLWSIGCVYYEMLFGIHPFLGITQEDILQRINNSSGDQMTFPSSISEPSKDLLRRLLQKDPTKRIDWKDFYKHPLFNTVQAPSAPAVTDHNFSKPIMTTMTKMEMEFKNHKDGSLTGQANPMTLNPESMLKPTPENETPGAGRIQAQLKEIGFRCNHEKNKLAFLGYALQQIDMAFRENWVPKGQPFLYNVKLLLAKKKIFMTHLILSKLNEKVNFFGIHDLVFKQFLASPQYPIIYKQFVQGYQAECEAFQKEVKQPMMALVNIDILKSPVPPTQQLDKFLLDLYQRLNQMTSQVDGAREQAYCRMLMCLLCSIYCENSFPYKAEEVKFKWDQFYKELLTFTPADFKRVVIVP